MSHDRGCYYCGREQWEYDECTVSDCIKRNPKSISTSIPFITKNDRNSECDIISINWKYDEADILKDLEKYLKNTYGEHYKSDNQDIECFDAWIALGDSGPTFRNTALKYLWRYGKKNGKNKADLFKALHYIFLLLHVDHYGDKT